MSLCVIDGKQCQCQPDIGGMCEMACQLIVAADARIAELEKALHESLEWHCTAMIEPCIECGETHGCSCSCDAKKNYTAMRAVLDRKL